MQKVLCLAALAAVLGAAAAPVCARGVGFIAVSAGQSRTSIDSPSSGFGLSEDSSNYRADKKDTMFGVIGGYRWIIDDAWSIGPEAGYVDLGGADYSGSNGSIIRPIGIRAKLTNKAVLLGANSKWLIGDGWSLTLRTGLARARSEQKSSYEHVPTYGGGLVLPAPYTEYDRSTSNDTGFYGALAVGYDFTDHFGVTLGYEHYSFRFNRHSERWPDFDQNIGVWAAGAEFRF
ncbi:Outer membrane protein beta-barrel domain-containing protein [Luteibacter sp. UNC138MFCol5.1]|uniref:outer membrane protein n=1 Tax=Luteibacter sp. UNC138MFCol5.1 TaxID=1502774 RepID=UPI0008BEEE56|nr:outer membrane beta-barrel protein [Luteibacter sp. UNC138MFCol5.1]SEO40747.1 Outer membrane protein beta-barrel domain-containing protein [Luteibacter sp. UNC138MFCol5.1]